MLAQEKRYHNMCKIPEVGKMISPQNVTTGVSTTALVGKEGLIIRRTFFHSVILAVILGVIVLIQQYLIPGIIPH